MAATLCIRGHKRTAYPNGRYRCKICENAAATSRFRQVPRSDRIAAYRGHALEKDRNRTIRATWRKLNPDRKPGPPRRLSDEERYARKLASRKRTYEKNKTSVLAQAAIYRAAHKDEERATRKAYYERNKERTARVTKAYREANRPKYNAYAAKRRAIKKQAIPAWADLAKIAEIYEAAAWLTAQSGEPFEVDHIFPLNSPVMCGLHVEDNLQILPASENRSKSNRLPSD